MERRKALKIIALGTLAPVFDSSGSAMPFVLPKGAAWTAGDYTLQFFTPAENEMVDRLTEMIIPADSHSPGAHAAQVSLFADMWVATSNDDVKTVWRNGLRLYHEAAAKSSLADALALSAKNEKNPASELDRFFRTIKDMTINAYYTSKIGIDQDLNYIGNTYLESFPGYPPLP